MKKKKVGIIGAGNIFEVVHQKYFMQRKDVEIIGLTDISVDHVKKMAARYNIPYCFSNAEEMLKQLMLDVVVVCVPNKYHYENVMLALQYDCHVLCEKPPSILASEAKKMRDYAIEKNKVLAYNLHWRHSKEVMLLKTRIQKGELGEIYNVKVQALRRLGIPGWGNFIDQSMQGGGPLIDLGIHMLDVAMYLLDYPDVDHITSVSHQEIGNRKNKGTLGNWDPSKYTVEDSIFALIRFKNGTSLQLETSFALNIKEKSSMNVWLRGTEAGASVFPLEIYSDTDGELTDMTFPQLIEVDKQAIAINNFLDQCDGIHTILADGECGYKLQNIIESIYKAAKENKLVKL